jgi:hypothetical protein
MTLENNESLRLD